MALKSLLGFKRTLQQMKLNLEQGRIWSANNGNHLQDYVTDFAGELHVAKQLLKCGAQVVPVLECVVAVEVFRNAAGYSKTYN